MALTINLPPELEKRLAKEADRHGMAPDQYAAQLLQENLPPQNQRAEAVALLQSWIDETDDAEQRQTGEYLVQTLVQTLDQDRIGVSIGVTA